MDQTDDLALKFVASHELAVPVQLATLLNVPEQEAEQRLEALVAASLATRVRLSAQSPPAFRITPAAAERVDPDLPELQDRLMRDYRHHLGVGRLWLAARDRAFGELAGHLSTREMKAADTSGRSRDLLFGAGLSFGAPLPGAPATDSPAYPDLGLVLPQEQRGWVAMHLQLATPDRDRVRSLIERYNRDVSIRRVLFLVDDRDRVGAMIREVADQVDTSDKVRVQRVDPAIAGG